jgi:hypothetical protein
VRVFRRSAKLLTGGAIVASTLLVGGSAGAATPIDLSGAEVCALAAEVETGTALGGTVTRPTSSTIGTPQCMYFLRTAAGTTVSVTVAVQRADGDLGGKTGTKAYKYVLKQNKGYSGAAKFVKVPQVGTMASFADGPNTNLMFALTRDGRVITMAGTDLTKQGAQALGQLVVANLDKR